MAKHTPPTAPPTKAEPKASPAQGPSPEPASSTTPAATKAGEPTSVPALSIRSIPQGGFCRAGRRWVPSPQIVPVSDFTDEQLDALRAERNLVVEDTEITPELEA